MLSWLVRLLFRIPINDVYCGMRGFKRELYDRLDLRSPGMEFATEMIIKSGLYDASMSQVPITLHPDGRQVHGPCLLYTSPSPRDRQKSRMPSSA